MIILKRIENKCKNLSSNTKEFSYYFLGSLFAKIILIAVFLLMTRVFTASQMGEVELYNTTVSLFVPILSIQIWEATIRFFRNQTSNESISSNLVVILFLQVLVLVFLEVLYPKDHIFLTSLLIILNNFLSYYARAIGMTKLFKLSEIMHCLFLGLFMFFLVEKGAEGYIFSNVLSYSCSLGIIFYLLINKITFKWNTIDLKIIKVILKYTTPLICNALGWWLITSIDKIVLAYYYDTSAVGIYSVSIRVAGIMMLVLQNLYFVYQRQYIHFYTEKQLIPPNLGEKYFYIVYALVLFFLLLPSGIIKFMLGVSGEFLTSIKYYYLYTPVMLYWAMSVYFGLGYLMTGKTIGASITTVMAAAISLILNFILTKYYAVTGAVVTSLIAVFLWFVFRYTTQKKYLNFELNILHWTAILLLQGIAVVRFIFA